MENFRELMELVKLLLITLVMKLMTILAPKVIARQARSIDKKWLLNILLYSLFNINILQRRMASNQDLQPKSVYPTNMYYN